VRCREENLKMNERRGEAYQVPPGDQTTVQARDASDRMQRCTQSVSQVSLRTHGLYTHTSKSAPAPRLPLGALLARLLIHVSVQGPAEQL
jgi:hypothetical protein